MVFKRAELSVSQSLFCVLKGNLLCLFPSPDLDLDLDDSQFKIIHIYSIMGLYTAPSVHCPPDTGHFISFKTNFPLTGSPSSTNI